jgi:hypothetical protein
MLCFYQNNMRYLLISADNTIKKELEIPAEIVVKKYSKKRVLSSCSSLDKDKTQRKRKKSKPNIETAPAKVTKTVQHAKLILK